MKTRIKKEDIPFLIKVMGKLHVQDKSITIFKSELKPDSNISSIFLRTDGSPINCFNEEYY